MIPLACGCLRGPRLSDVVRLPDGGVRVHLLVHIQQTTDPVRVILATATGVAVGRANVRVSSGRYEGARVESAGRFESALSGTADGTAGALKSASVLTRELRKAKAAAAS